MEEVHSTVPKMLKTMEKPNDAESLQHRRIRNLWSSSLEEYDCVCLIKLLPITVSWEGRGGLHIFEGSSQRERRRLRFGVGM